MPPRPGALNLSVDPTVLDDLELINCFRKGWDGNQRDFCQQFGVEEPTLSKFLSRKVTESPKSREAIIRWLNKEDNNNNNNNNKPTSSKARRQLLPDFSPQVEVVDPSNLENQELIDLFLNDWDDTKEAFSQQYGVDESLLLQFLAGESESKTIRRAIIRWLGVVDLGDDQEIVDLFRNIWEGNQREFCREYGINEPIFSKYLNRRVKTSPTVKRAIEKWLNKTGGRKMRISGKKLFEEPSEDESKQVLVPRPTLLLEEPTNYTDLNDIELITLFKKKWDGNQRKFCQENKIGESTLSQYLNGKVVSSPECRNAILGWLEREGEGEELEKFERFLNSDDGVGDFDCGGGGGFESSSIVGDFRGEKEVVDLTLESDGEEVSCSSSSSEPFVPSRKKEVVDLTLEEFDEPTEKRVKGRGKKRGKERERKEGKKIDTLPSSSSKPSTSSVLKKRTEGEIVLGGGGFGEKAVAFVLIAAALSFLYSYLSLLLSLPSLF